MQREPPLNDREIRIVRGMIDEHLYEQARRRLFSGWFGDARVALAVFGGAVLLATNVIGLVFLLLGRR